jgi:hypothetical protein
MSPHQNRNGGSDGTRTRGLLRDRQALPWFDSAPGTLEIYDCSGMQARFPFLDQLIHAPTVSRA